MNNKKRVIVKGPQEPAPFSIYRITIGRYVYVGHAQDIEKRATQHARDKRRIVGQLFAKMSCDMLVEHIDAADTKEQARELEQQHIERETREHCQYMLNVHHASRKWDVIKLN